MPQKRSRPSGLTLAAKTLKPADLPFTEAGRALLKAGFLFLNHPERPYHRYDLTVSQIDVLVTLAGAEGASLNCSEIADRTLITKGGITGILDRLEARGLVKRIPSRDDRRSVLIRLSDKGVALFVKLYPELGRVNRVLLEKAFKPNEMKEFGRLLGVLIQSLGS
jgi:MarR family transcriptional regulator, 2-MHQ and catechol-resistance regulon repressor